MIYQSALYYKIKPRQNLTPPRRAKQLIHQVFRWLLERIQFFMLFHAGNQAHRQRRDHNLYRHLDQKHRDDKLPKAGRRHSTGKSNHREDHRI